MSGEGATAGDGAGKLIYGRHYSRVIEDPAHIACGAVVDIFNLVFFKRTGLFTLFRYLGIYGVENLCGNWRMHSDHGARHNVRYHHCRGDIEIMKKIVPVCFHRNCRRRGVVILVREIYHRPICIERNIGHEIHCIECGQRDSHTGKAVSLVVFIEICECERFSHIIVLSYSNSHFLFKQKREGIGFSIHLASKQHGESSGKGDSL